MEQRNINNIILYECMDCQDDTNKNFITESKEKNSFIDND